MNLAFSFVFSPKHPRTHCAVFVIAQSVSLTLFEKFILVQLEQKNSSLCLSLCPSPTTTRRQRFTLLSRSHSFNTARLTVCWRLLQFLHEIGSFGLDMDFLSRKHVCNWEGATDWLADRMRGKTRRGRQERGSYTVEKGWKGLSSPPKSFFLTRNQVRIQRKCEGPTHF